MTFRILEDESVETGIKRIAGEQIDKAIGELTDEALGPHETVHQVRKRCKKIRGVIRLVRPRFEEIYRFENAWFRDAARTLSYLRDAEAMIETYDDLMKVFDEQIDRSAFASVRRALTLRRRHIAEDRLDLEERLEKFLAAMREARARVDAWPLEAEGFDGIDAGLSKTYRRGRKAMMLAYREPSTEQFHEWRKRVKYYRYHTRLLRDLWKPVMKKYYSEVKELSDILGDDHDLAVFRQTLLDNPQEFGGKRDIQALVGLIDRRRAQLQAQARPLGERIYAEKPKRLARRLGCYWEAWRSPNQQKSSKLAESAVPPQE